MFKQHTNAAYFKAFNILFVLFILGQVLLAVIIYLLNKSANGKTMPKQEAQLFTGIVAAVMFTCIAINRSVFKKRIRLIKQEPGLFRQLDAYRALYITRLAFAEASTLFAIIIAFITRSRPVWFLVAISILSAISLRPSKRRLIENCNWEAMMHICLMIRKL